MTFLFQYTIVKFTWVMGDRSEDGHIHVCLYRSYYQWLTFVLSPYNLLKKRRNATKDNEIKKKLLGYKNMFGILVTTIRVDN